jgi:flagellar protein FlbT
MTLRISLRNGEPVIVNGAVLRAVGRTDLVLENEATILRGREVMKPQDADSPAKQLYFACMMAYIDPADIARHQQALLERLEALLSALESPEAKGVCVHFAQKVATGQFYQALGECRWLIAYEADALARLDAAAAVAPVLPAV